MESYLSSCITAGHVARMVLLRALPQQSRRSHKLPRARSFRPGRELPSTVVARETQGMIYVMSRTTAVAVITLATLATAIAGAAATGTTAANVAMLPEANDALAVPQNASATADLQKNASDIDAAATEATWKDETDPFRRCARKALAGLYGPLADWQRDAYVYGIETGVECDSAAKVTSYGPWEPAYMSGGSVTASGSRVHLRGCAANPAIPFGTLIWTPYGLRYVTDRGGWVKVGYARVFGRMKKVTTARETANFDYYTKREWNTLRNAPYAIVKKSGDRTVWYVTGSRRG